MNNQAAQTMPELPKSFGEHCVYDSVRVMREPGYTAAQMHQYARDYAAMLAAAPAASGGEDVGRADCGACPKPIGCKVGQCRHGLDNTPESRAPQLPSSASVRERARAIEILAGVCLVPPSSVTENTDSDVSVELALRAIEQALTQQRGEPVPSIVREVLEWYASDPRIWVGWNKEGWAEEEAAKASGHYTFIGEDERGHNEYVPNHVRAEEALAAYDEWLGRESTTPQPSADAVRELVRRWRDRAHEARSKAEGSPAYEVEFSTECGVYVECADELESLLSADSGEKGVGK